MDEPRWSSTTFFAIALVAAALSGALIVWIFGEEPYLVELAAGFGASLAAFALALAWEREREQRQARAEKDRQAAAETAERERTEEEIRRIFESLAGELEENERGFEKVGLELARIRRDQPDRFVPVLPMFFDGVWTTTAPRLSRILEYHRVLGELANLYGQVDELRFRMRYRTEARTTDVDAEIEELLATASEALRQARIVVTNYDDIVAPIRGLAEDTDVTPRIRQTWKR